LQTGRRIKHIPRSDGLLKDVIERILGGKRTQERRRLGKLDNVMVGTYGVMNRKSGRKSWIN